MIFTLFWHYNIFPVRRNFWLKEFVLIVQNFESTWKRFAAHLFPQLIITYHYLILIYFHICTFTNNVYLFEANLNLLASTSTPDSWLCTVPLREKPHCQLPSLLVHWSYQERNTHAIIWKHRDVQQQMHRDSSLQWLNLQAEQHFWGFIRRSQVKHLVLL